ncbi:MAG: alpha/beta hydrolase [Alphaproteobacteria bacterium]|nr:MAG: alpha/beta hydrolase [Alphaproteobacteria bacterium]
MAKPSFLDTSHGARIAYHRTPGSSPGIIFLGGFRSDMTGTKATRLAAWAEAHGQAFLRFDYSGHGASSGRFEDGAIGDWLADALAVPDHLAQGPRVLVGSSMGGWIALLAARKRPRRIAGLVLIAPAPDFTERLMWDILPPDNRREILEKGFCERPSAYDNEPDIITRRLIEDGRHHLLLDGPVAVTCPVRILHGMADADVPWRLSIELVEKLASHDVELTLVKDGDHRLSGEADLARLERTLDTLFAGPGAAE